VSGKGGVGKTNLVANLSVAAAGLGAKVLLVDGDLGLANVDVLLGMHPVATAADVLEGRCRFEDAVQEGPRGIHLLAAASGRTDLPGLRPAALARLLIPLFGSTGRYDLVFVDAGAGLGAAVIGLAAACDRALLVTTPEPTSLADAYATLKVLGREAPALRVDVVVNGARDALQARDTHVRLARLADRFLAMVPSYLGHLPSDPRLGEAVARQRAVVEIFPGSPSARHIVKLAETLLATPRPASAPGSRPDDREVRR
jgi:flagellar biosynthesis protein FlhG